MASDPHSERDPVADRNADRVVDRNDDRIVELVVEVDWPYDAAITAMHDARDRVIAGERGTIFVGSHREEIVTLGRHAPDAQLVARNALDARGVLVRRIERGGGATAHGPGQLVVYPVVHLEKLGFDVPRLTRALLEACVDFAVDVGLARDRIEAPLDPAGVYVDVDEGAKNACLSGKKLASIGMRIQNGVVTHGLAVNCINDLTLFQLIAPCGISNQPMASLASLGVLDSEASLIDLAKRLAQHVSRRCVLRWP